MTQKLKDQCVSLRINSPVVDWNQLGEGLERIGMTARDINQKRLDGLKSKRSKLAELQPEKTAQ